MDSQNEMFHIQFKNEASKRKKNIYLCIIENDAGGDCLFWSIFEFIKQRDSKGFSIPENVQALK